MDRRAFHACLLAVGSSSIATQLVMVREFMATFAGNELVVGVTLGVWLLAGGLGSKLAAAPAEKTARFRGWLFCGHLALAFLPLAQLAAVRAMPLLWVRGQMLGFSQCLAGALVILAPYAALSGAMLPLAGRLEAGDHKTARVYVADTVGDIAGGLFFGLFCVFFLSHGQTLVLFGLLHLAAAFFVAAKTGFSRPGRALLPFLAALLALALFAERQTGAWRYPDQKIILWKNSPFSQLVITSKGRQYNVWQDNTLLFTTQDPRVESLVHPAMAQVKPGACVLLVGGGVFQSLEEIQKHAPSRVDYVELDKAILNLDGLLFSSLKKKNVFTHVGDGRLFIKKTPLRFDVVILDLPEPDNAQINRFYTKEFFREARGVLKEGGVLCFALPGAENYMEEKGLALNRTVYAALKQEFSQVLVLPGTTHFFLASRRPLSLDIAQVLAQRNVRARQLVDYDLFSLADPFRVDELARLLETGHAKPNQDLSPWAFGHIMDLWMAQSKSSAAVFWAVLAFTALFCVLAWFGRRERWIILSSGYAGMGVELALVLLFQVVYGYAYTALCFFVTLFLAGSAAGGLGYFRKRPDPSRTLWITEAGLMAVALCAIASALAGARPLHGAGLALLGYVAFPVQIILAGACAGAQFAAVSEMEKGPESRVIGSLYLADLAGACAGTLVTGLVLLPRAGILGVLVSIVAIKGLNLAAGGLARLR